MSLCLEDPKRPETRNATPEKGDLPNAHGKHITQLGGTSVADVLLALLGLLWTALGWTCSRAYECHVLGLGTCNCKQQNLRNNVIQCEDFFCKYEHINCSTVEIHHSLLKAKLPEDPEARHSRNTGSLDMGFTTLGYVYCNHLGRYPKKVSRILGNPEKVAPTAESAGVPGLRLRAKP